MEIKVNNQIKDVPDNVTLLDVVHHELNGNFRGVAVAVDKKIVPQGEWKNFKIKEGNQILIIKATQGG
ncbi:MAG: sulfur carrier protein ThiS [Bacteroidia bacterium]|nr:sulfur carrier protein ThiS [Bacteroidia bacterium]